MRHQITNFRNCVHVATVGLKGLVAGLVVTLCAPTTVLADNSWVVRNMRVEGLQRITEGTIFNYLPVDVGDTVDTKRIDEALRAAYATGFFSDLEARRDGDTLVLAVRERPSIQSLNIDGNKDIKTEDLMTNLRGAGVAPGEPFDKSVLDEIERFLIQEYFSRGKYGARVETNVTELPGNKVGINIDIREGDRARIRQINIVGNTTYSDEELLDEFSLKTPNLLCFYKKNCNYSKEALSGDRESLASYYMDRGFANFDIESTQVAISPDLKDIYVTVNINEGERFKIADVKLSGDLVVPEQQLQALVLLKPGQTFSRKLITQTTDLINLRLGQEGYAFSRVDPIPEIDEKKREVSVTLRVNPGKRVYVRRINFNGTKGVNDEVFRREMRQLEGAWLSNSSLERSQQRIRRLAFVENVEFDTEQVAGTPDLVDVDFDIQEGLPGQFGGGLGFSGSQGLLINGNFTHTNFLGTGNRVAAEINLGRFSDIYSINYTNPYRTLDGLSRSLGFAYRDTTQFVLGASEFSTETLSASVNWGLPLSEYSALRYGLTYQDSDLLTGRGSATQSIQFVSQNGNPYSLVNQNLPICGDPAPFTDPDTGVVSFGLTSDICGTKFKTYELFLGFVYDTRNRVIFANRGARQVFSVGYTLPGSEVEYYSLSYDFQRYFPVYRDFVISARVELGFVEPLGDSLAPPPFKNFFAGGPDSVRGFENSRLGPYDSRGNPYGGNAKAVGQFELLLPTPEKLRSSTRFSLFYDIGNVFSTGGDVAFTDGAGRPVDYRFDFDDMRQSAGLAVSWLAPLGTFRFSYAFPLNAQDGAPGETVFSTADRIERFQFSVGSAF